MPANSAMIILGLNAYHADSSACLVKDGVLVAAAEEEHFRHIKHWAGFPSDAIRYFGQQPLQYTQNGYYNTQNGYKDKKAG